MKKNTASIMLEGSGILFVWIWNSSFSERHDMVVLFIMKGGGLKCLPELCKDDR